MKNIFGISRKFLAVILALYLSTLVISKNSKPIGALVPDNTLSCPAREVYFGSKGLPIPYNYQRSDKGGYRDNIVFFTINFWFWIGFFLITDEFIIKGKFVLEKWRLKILLNSNIFYLVFSFVFYFSYLFYVKHFLALSTIC